MKKLLIACTLLGSLSAGAQTIPNSGFETWSATGPMLMPTGWAGSPTVRQSNSAHSGMYAIMCVTDTFTNPFTSTLDTMAGVAYSGAALTGPPTPGTNLPGFAMTARPDSLTGFFKFRGMGGDTFHVSATLSKWNAATSSRDVIASADFNESHNDSNYKRFSTALQYSSTASPDTCVIMITGSNPNGAKHMGTSVWVDDLAFITKPSTGIATAVTTAFVVWPNPFTDKININSTERITTLSLIDMSGKMITSGTGSTLQIDGVPAGNYVLVIQTASGVQNVHVNKR